MQTITFKIQEDVLRKIDKIMKTFNFSTKTEFIRGAIREKLNKLETELFMKKLAKYKGFAKTTTSDEELEKIREKVGNKYLKKLEAKLKIR